MKTTILLLLTFICGCITSESLARPEKPNYNLLRKFSPDDGFSPDVYLYHTRNGFDDVYIAVRGVSISICVEGK